MPPKFKVNKKYNYFCVSNTSGKIVDGWEYPKHYTRTDVMEFYKLDMTDNDRDRKTHKLLTTKQLIKSGVDPFNWDSWANK